MSHSDNDTHSSREKKRSAEAKRHFRGILSRVLNLSVGKTLLGVHLLKIGFI